MDLEQLRILLETEPERIEFPDVVALINSRYEERM